MEPLNPLNYATRDLNIAPSFNIDITVLLLAIAQIILAIFVLDTSWDRSKIVFEGSRYARIVYDMIGSPGFALCIEMIIAIGMVGVAFFNEPERRRRWYILYACVVILLTVVYVVGAYILEKSPVYVGPKPAAIPAIGERYRAISPVEMPMLLAWWILAHPILIVLFARALSPGLSIAGGTARKRGEQFATT